jgi:hypothetical protein
MSARQITAAVQTTAQTRQALLYVRAPSVRRSAPTGKLVKVGDTN